LASCSLEQGILLGSAANSHSNDFTISDAADGETTHVVGGKSSEGIKFAAVEIASGRQPLPDLASIPKSLAATPANKVSDVSRSSKGGADSSL
jgi:hypothetical protein